MAGLSANAAVVRVLEGHRLSGLTLGVEVARLHLCLLLFDHKFEVSIPGCFKSSAGGI